MQEYYFLYAIAFIWIVFATVQDLKTTEIANWLSFSLIAFVLAYRAFYASLFEGVMFFVYGLMGVLLFVVLGYIFYYGKVFAGGDAKLLMGLGGIWPYAGFLDYLYIGLGFIFVLFIAGAIYTLVYSLFLITFLPILTSFSNQSPSTNSLEPLSLIMQAFSTAIV